MLQIKKLNLTHKKDLRVILDDFNLVLNDGDKAVIIGEEGNGKSTLMKWIYDPSLIENYIEADGELPHRNGHTEPDIHSTTDTPYKANLKCSSHSCHDSETNQVWWQLHLC